MGPNTHISNRQLDPEALGAAVRALEALAHERTVAKLRQEADDVGPTLEPSQDGSYALPYDPASVFLLETMTSITCKTPDYIQDLWPIIYEHISALLSTPTQYSILLIERAVVGLLRICLILASQASIILNGRINMSDIDNSLHCEIKSMSLSTSWQTFHLVSRTP